MENEVRVDRGPFEMVPHWILFHQDLSPLAVRLYLVLRQHADSRGDCFPSRRRLSDLLRVSLPTLDKARQQLVDVGALTMDRRKGAGDEWLSCIYRVHWEAKGSKESLPGVVKNLSDPSKESYALTKTQLTYTEDPKDIDHHDTNDVTPRPSQAHRANESPTGQDVPGTNAVAVRSPQMADFDRFWDAYPRRVGKKAAYVAWTKAVTEADPETIIAGALRYANDPNRDDTYTAHPQTWLRAGRWDDEPLPARTTRQATGGERRMDAYQDLASKIGNRQRGITA